MEMKQPMFSIRIESARESIKRARLIFFISTVISLSVLFTVWNAYLSWYRGLALEHHSWSANPVTEHLQKELLSEWVKSRIISIAIFGIRVGVSDAAPLSSISLFVTSVWFFYSLRRSNHVIGSLLIDSQNEDGTTKRMIYHGIVSSMVFLDITGNDEPIRKLDDRPDNPPFKIPYIRGAVKLLAFLPAITIFFTVIMDILSIFYFRSPFRNLSDHPLIEDIGLHEWIWISVFEVSALLLGLTSCFLIFRSLAFEQGTAQIMSQYLDKMEK